MRYLVLAVAALIGVAANPAPVSAQRGERIAAGAIGISIEMPKGWMQAPPGTVTRSLLALDLKSPEFRRAVETNGLEPLITIVKYPAPQGTSIPAVKIQYLAFPLRDISVIDLTKRTIDPLHRTYGDDLVVLDPPSEVLISGMTAGYRRVRFTAFRDGVPYPTISELWIIRRGDYLIMIGANYDPAVPDQTKAEVRAALDSIVIRPE